MAEEKEYIVHFYDGRVRRMPGPLSELHKLPVSKIEEAPPSINPANIIRRDMERITRALRQPFKLFQNGPGFPKPPFGGGFFRGV